MQGVIELTDTAGALQKRAQMPDLVRHMILLPTKPVGFIYSMSLWDTSKGAKAVQPLTFSSYTISEEGEVELLQHFRHHGVT